VPLGTIKSRVNRALERLKQLLADGRPSNQASSRKMDVPLRPIRVIEIAKPAIVSHVITAPIMVLPNIVAPVASVPRPAATLSVRSIRFMPITTEAMYGNFRIRSTVLRRIQ
jgi:hypothetical protein